MKKITLLITMLLSVVIYAQTYYTEDFSSEILVPVPQDAVTPGLNDSYISNIDAGDGKWFTVAGFGVTDFGIQATGGNPGNYVSRISETQYARAIAYVYNNSDNSVTGSYNLSFDYFFNTSFDNAHATNERFGYRVFGLTQAPVLGAFVMTSGNGDFGDNNATNYDGSGDQVELKGHTHLPHTDSWANSGSFSVDFGSAGTYKYIVVVFGQVFGTIQTSNPVATYFGIDNVVLPTQSNPQPTILSTKKYNKPLYEIYPNPVKDILQIQNINGEFSYKIYNVTGKLLKTTNNQISNNINISDLITGTYILEVTNSEGVKSTNKIIKL